MNEDAAAITLDATLNSQGNTSTVLAGTWELFQDGVSINTGTITGGPVDRLALWHQGDNPNDVPSNFYMNDFAVYTNSAVPEPSALALLGMSILGLAGCRRRRS